MARKRVKITNTPAPAMPRQVERGGRRVKISDNVAEQVRQQRTRLQYGQPGWRERVRRGLPTSESRVDAVTEIQESERFAAEHPQGAFIPLTYDPTKTSWPANGWDHRRTRAAGYDRQRGILRVEFFTDGAVYDYGILTPVPPYVAYQFRMADSPGRFINSTLESYGYVRIN